MSPASYSEDAEEVGMTIKDIVDQARVVIEIFSKEGTPLRRDASRPLLFALCLEAYRLVRRDPTVPQLTVENLRTFLMSQWSAHEDKERRRCLDEACEMWREWWYALEHSRD
jgi:hypothetical protein